VPEKFRPPQGFHERIKLDFTCYYRLPSIGKRTQCLRRNALFTANEILDMAIKLEKNGEVVYRDAIEKVSNPELITLLEWMANEEAKHADWFAEFKLKLDQKSVNPFLEKMSRELFNDLLGDKNFFLKDVDFSSVSDLDALIAIFIEFEKDSVRFYQILEPFIGDPVSLESLKKIIDEENCHIKRLQELRGRKEVFIYNNQ
jgi:rubrerythrin